jgi:hypothetical protein
MGDVEEQVGVLLEELPPDDRRVFALVCAERAMASHLQLPDSDQRPFTLGWQPVLDAIRAGLLGDPSAESVVRAGLDAFHAGPYDHSEGQDGPDDAAEEAASAAIYAAECFLSGMPEAARWAADRVVELRIAGAGIELGDRLPSPEGLAAENAHPAVQAELRRQLDDLAMLAAGERSAVLGRSIGRP